MLFIPGPTEVRPEILEECAREMIGHRSPAMAELIERIDPHLPHAFGLAPGSPARWAVATCSATGLMEAALHGVGRRVLAVVNGAFAARFRDVARALGRETVTLEVPWGRAVGGQELARALSEGGPFDALTLVANETSTGVFTPLGPVRAALDAVAPETLLLVDCVTLLGGAPVDFDRHRVDLALAGSQKALALPPGLALFCASERYLERARAVPQRGWYLDPVRLVEGHAARKTPTTPAIPLYRALARQLEDITAGVTLPARDRGRTGAEAWTARFEKHARMRARTLAWAEEHGLKPFPEAPETRSQTVSCIRAGGVDVAALASGLARRGFEISNGYGELKGRTFRIGHMGDHTEEDLEALLAAADEVIGEGPPLSGA